MEILKKLYPDLPGTEELPTLPREKFRQVLSRREPHSRFSPEHAYSSRYTNRLILQSSPYLLQHAHNPVNWFPWGTEAFDLAGQLNRPVLVSIGYATCHWCHVMEKECFENEEVAKLLNGNFIAVKVDREERPDVDAVYMAALHAMGVQGGWPLHVFVTPRGKPFFGGTYFSVRDTARGPGFITILQSLKEAYLRQRDRVESAGTQLVEAVRSMLNPTKMAAELNQDLIKEAVQACQDSFDEINGGIGGAPKFPSSLPLGVLLRHYLRTGEAHLIDMVDLTLHQMASGGIYDHIGGGFHRYATDESWCIPHFEKMLYDNALLAVSYLEGYQAIGKDEFSQVASEILQYLTEEMQSADGGFYSATDADSRDGSGEQKEGFFFTWSYGELKSLLSSEMLEMFCDYYGASVRGNFEGRNVLHRLRSVRALAVEQQVSEATVLATLQEAKQILQQARRRRPPPFRDEKIITSWNALAVSAFARAAVVLDDGTWLERALHTAEFILREMVVPGWKLAHSYQEGEARGEGFLDDHAFLIAAFIDLFQVTGEIRWLQHSTELVDIVEAEFEDTEVGGFFMTGADHEQLIAREKPIYDGVLPSGNSAMIMNLLRLYCLTEEARYLEKARRGIDLFVARASSTPIAHSELLAAVDFLNHLPQQLAIVTPQGNREAARPLLEVVRKTYMPNVVLVVVSEDKELERVTELVPFLRGKHAKKNQAVAYFCRDRSCRMPTTDPAELATELRNNNGP